MQRAAARAERQSRQVDVLRQVVGDAEVVDARRPRGRADGQAAHLLRRGQVALHQRRRQLEHAGNVVEPVAHIVAGQERRDVEIEAQQIAHRVAVLDAVQAMERFGAARVRAPRPTRDRARLPATTRSRRARPCRDAARRPAASARRAASAPPSPTPRRRRATLREVERVERHRHRAALLLRVVWQVRQ